MNKRAILTLGKKGIFITSILRVRREEGVRNRTWGRVPERSDFREEGAESAGGKVGEKSLERKGGGRG